ncbi:MAG: acyl-CoA dehydrogenase family protein [Deltaproteobacteria bacterium]|jgi:alkylation response protein AidB-like acyl-CoA dehydrogenase|nr:acyl-CoA dehydrogenase family protein [Deltaproteobacteria bacterium]MBW2532774.1 acyl-CoA dehydrogenase family protein [Deltaproteobacteria bacterium]
MDGLQTSALDRETLQLTLESIRAFGKAKLGDSALLGFDAADEFPESIVRGMGSAELGIQLLFIPIEYGGMGGGAFDVYRVCELLARIDLGIATGVLATFLGSDPIVFGGTKEQQQRWLGRIADEGLLMAYAATEPQAGSDLAALRTSATPVEKDGRVVGYTIDGTKQWISNGGYADLYTVLANTPKGPSWFVVDRGTEGLSFGPPEDKHGIRASNTAALTFDELFVEAERLVGREEGLGLKQAQDVFGFTRLMVAAFGLGAGWAALDRAIEYSLERKQGGSPLADKQGYTHKLIVPHAVRLEAARALIEETAERIDAGEGSLNTEGAVAKYLASEAGDAAADAAIQALGGYGYAREYMVEKIKRDVRITRIYEGTSEILEMTIARDRWQQHLKSRGQHYHREAEELERLAAEGADFGAATVALGLHALGELLERARADRLTRNQHVLFRLGATIARMEGAACLARRAARSRAGKLCDKADGRLNAEGLAVASRIYAREAALGTVAEALQWVAGAQVEGDDRARSFEEALGLSAIHRAQVGQVQDMDRFADLLYRRS